MAAFTEQDLMRDLATADAAGDTQLAQHIAGRIKELRGMQLPGEQPAPDFSTKVRTFFDPGYGREFRPTDIPRQMIKGAGLVAASGASIPAAVLSGGLLSASEEDATPLSVLGGAGAAGAAAKGLQLAGKYVVPPVVNWLRGKWLEQGRRALTGNAGTIGAQAPLSEGAVRAATDTGAIRPLAGIRGIADRLGASVDEVEGRLGEVLSQLEQAGVSGPEPVVVEKILKDRGLDAFRNSGLEKIRRVYAETANSLSEIGQTQRGPLGLTQAENIKRAHQAEANYSRAARDTNSMRAQKEVASVLRQANEDAVAAQAAKAPELAEQFVPLKRELGPLLEAQDAADIAAARAGRRQSHGLGSMVMAAGGLAHGNLPEAVAMMYGTQAVKSRGPATFAWTYDKLAKVLARAQSQSPATRAAAQSELHGLIEAMRRRVDAGLLPPVPADTGDNQ